MIAMKRRMFCAWLSIFMMLVFISCQTSYEPVSLAHVPFFSFKEHQIRSPEFFTLGSYDLHTNLWIINDDEKACYVNLSFFSGLHSQRILNLEVSVENFKTKQTVFELQDVVLSYAHCGELNPKRTKQQFKTSLLSINMDTANCYSLRYTYKLKRG